MPLFMMNVGDKCTVTTLKGKIEQIRFLKNLGFVEGAKICVISKSGKNMIVEVVEARVALGEDMTPKIMVVPA